MDQGTTDIGVRFSTGLSMLAETGPAVAQACAACREGLAGVIPDLVMVFFSARHAEHAAEVLRTARREMRGAGMLIGVSAAGVICGGVEVERSPGVSVVAARLPGCVFHPFVSDDLPPLGLGAGDELERMAAAIGADENLLMTLLFADGHTLPLVHLIPAMNACRARGTDGLPVGTLVGGLASGGIGGASAMLLQDRVLRHGAVGVSIKRAVVNGVAVAPKVRVDAFVSQGCAPFGPTFVVTKARGNVIQQLGGRPALEVVQEVVGELPEAERAQLRSGLYIGRVINEYKDRFGRGDFLIRTVVGVDQTNGAIAADDLVRVGQTVRLHRRDARTASDDLSLMLDGQRLHEPPAGMLLITCNGRGTRLFSAQSHDAQRVVRAFAPSPGGETLAKGGTVIEPDTGPREGHAPLGGFFAGGEIGPVGGESFLHSQTACVVMFRDA